MTEVKDSLSREEFVNDYVRKCKPVILNDVTKGWPALTKWSPAYFKEIYQDQIVQITSGRDANDHLEVNIHNHMSGIKFSDYVDIANSYEGNDVYLVANNHFLARPEGAKILGDFSRNGNYFSPGAPQDANTRFWMGPKGTFTSLHHDEMDLFVVQVYGRKRIVMISPDQQHLLYNHVGVHSEINYENPDFTRHPLFDRTVRVEFTLHPGQAIFMPVGWWHFVKSLSASISLTLYKRIATGPARRLTPASSKSCATRPRGVRARAVQRSAQTLLKDAGRHPCRSTTGRRWHSSAQKVYSLTRRRDFNVTTLSLAGTAFSPPSVVGRSTPQPAIIRAHSNARA